jgi:hypothetical protein
MLARKGAAPATDRAVNRGQRAFKPAQPYSLEKQPEQTFAVCDGRISVGTVRMDGDSFVAIDTAGDIVGTFATLQAASRAFERGRS